MCPFHTVITSPTVPVINQDGYRSDLKMCTQITFININFAWAVLTRHEVIIYSKRC